MTFNLKKNDFPAQVSKIMANSEVLQVGEAVTINTSGFAVTCPTGTAVYGVVQAITKNNGGTPTTNGAGGDFVPNASFTAAGDNQTVDKYKVLIETSKSAIYSVGLDAAMANTTGSGIEGYHLDNATGALILSESSSTTGSAQWIVRGVDPEFSTTRDYVSIYESQIDA